MSRDFKFDKNLITGTSHAGFCTLMTVSRRILVGMVSVPDTSCRANQNTHFVFSNFSPLKPCHLWDVEKCRAGQATGGNIIRRMRFAFWIAKAIDTDSE